MKQTALYSSALVLSTAFLTAGCLKPAQVKDSQPVEATDATSTDGTSTATRSLTPPEEVPNPEVVTDFEPRVLSVSQGFAYDAGARLKRGIRGQKFGPYYAVPMGDFVFMVKDPKTRISPYNKGEGSYHWRAQFWRQKPPEGDQVPLAEMFETVQNATFDLNRELPSGVSLFKLMSQAQGRDYDKPPVKNWRYDENAVFDHKWHGKVMGDHQLLVNRKAGYVTFRDKETCRRNFATYSYRYQFWVWQSRNFNEKGIDLYSLYTAIDKSETDLDRDKPASY